MTKNRKIEIETELKFNVFWKASWKANFSHKMRQRCAKRARGGAGAAALPHRVAVLGRNLRRGIQEDIVQILKVWPYMSGDLGLENDLKDWKDLAGELGMPNLARRSRWGGGLKIPLGGAPPPHVFGVRALCALQEFSKYCVVMSGVSCGRG